MQQSLFLMICKKQYEWWYLLLLSSPSLKEKEKTIYLKNQSDE